MRRIAPLLLLSSLVACHDSPAKPSAASTAVEGSATSPGTAAAATPSAASGGKNWWTGARQRFSGKLNGGAKFTIELPASIEQLPPPTDYMFRMLDDAGAIVVAQLTIESMVEVAQHPQSYADYKERSLQSVKIVREEPGDLSWGVLFLDRSAPDSATALFATPAADSQSRCMWDVPRSTLQGDEVAGWGEMKRACRSITFSW